MFVRTKCNNEHYATKLVHYRSMVCSGHRDRQSVLIHRQVQAQRSMQAVRMMCQEHHSLCYSIHTGLADAL
jgi:hypothetical protein